MAPTYEFSVTTSPEDLTTWLDRNIGGSISSLLKKKKNIEDYLAGTLLIDHDDREIRFKPPIVRLYQDDDVEEWIGLTNHHIEKSENVSTIKFPGIIVRHFSDGHSASSPIGDVIRIEMWPKATGALVTIGCKREEYGEYVHFLHEKIIKEFGDKAGSLMEEKQGVQADTTESDPQTSGRLKPFTPKQSILIDEACRMWAGRGYISKNMSDFLSDFYKDTDIFLTIDQFKQALQDAGKRKIIEKIDRRWKLPKSCT